VPFDPLDEGERKLNPADISYVSSHFAETRIVPFHVFGRFARLWPAADPALRRLDQLFLKLPLASKLMGSALMVCRRA
jgi:hypothetical protein